MSDEVEMSMTVPLDGEGFLRRECPTCERELKWLAAKEGEEAEAAPDDGYFCPYCGVQAPPDSWFTKAQLQHASALMEQEVLAPELRKLKDSARRASGGFVQIDVDYTEPEPPQALTETDDMRRVGFSCHSEPVKVLEDWAGPVHCPLCGRSTHTG
jgi:hypothetical protein